jgi:hypothetical protein
MCEMCEICDMCEICEIGKKRIGSEQTHHSE